jgi:hypothetical protein
MSRIFPILREQERDFWLGPGGIFLILDNVQNISAFAPVQRPTVSSPDLRVLQRAVCSVFSGIPIISFGLEAPPLFVHINPNSMARHFLGFPHGYGCSLPVP